MSEQLEQIKNKIIETGKITAEELDTKIKQKLDSLGGLISEEGATHIIANELNISLGSAPTSNVKLKDVLPAMKNVTVLVKVLRAYEVRTFGADGNGKVGSLFVGDESGFMRLTFWNDKTDYLKGINEGDILEIQHAYAKENNDRIELHMGNASHCIVNPPGKIVEVKEREQAAPEAQHKKLEEINDNDTFVNITATIVQAYDPRFFESCPECNKRLREEEGAWMCAQHGAQQPNYNYVMNLFLDDGTSNMRATLWKEQIQQLLSMDDATVQQLRTDSEKLETIKTDLLGRIISARARVKLNEQYNTKELVLYSIDANPQPTTQSKEEVTLPETKKEEAQPEVASEEVKVSEDDLSASTADEELVSDDDEELLSIDDLDEDI